MDAATIEARARARAKDQHVHIFAVPGRPGVYTTKSKTNAGERYSLVARDGIVACSCKGYAYRANCKHSEQLKDRLARETVQAERQGRRLQAVA